MVVDGKVSLRCDDSVSLLDLNSIIPQLSPHLQASGLAEETPQSTYLGILEVFCNHSVNVASRFRHKAQVTSEGDVEREEKIASARKP